MKRGRNTERFFIKKTKPTLTTSPTVTPSIPTTESSPSQDRALSDSPWEDAMPRSFRDNIRLGNQRRQPSLRLSPAMVQHSP